ncbi:hypothetical protein SLEP1_g12614 [Rubroshorea leprosula]|uniref:Uncharacterized protein n=1 Tax=Rubroshorea leprosula TaxID=152421 RepID=A0AAV5IPG8_9ROSI|nr:hypothetical protein SLEP1_g12614 [Rubroshorea leprosula]
MPPRKSRDKEVQPAQAEHANDPITFLPVSPLAKRSYGNPIFKERDADRRDDFAESSNVFRGMTERLDLAFKEQNQAMRRLVESQAESSRREEELITQCIEEMRRVFEKGTRVMRETGEESHRPLQAVSEQVVEQEDDQSSTSPKVASVIVSPDGVLKATFEAQEQSGNHGSESKEDDTIHFGEFSVNLSCPVLTLPLVFQAKKEEESIVCEFPEQTEEEVSVVPAQDDEEEDMADKIVFEKPEEKMARHIRPLYINAHMDGTPISRGVNHSRGVLPVELTVGNKTLMFAFFVVDTVATYNALLGRDWIHSSWCVPSSLHQKLIFWNCGKAEVVSADDKPFSANTHLVEARYYEEDIGTIRFFGMDRHGKPIGITACSRPSLSKRAVEEVCDELLRPTTIIPYRPKGKLKIEEI